MYYYDKKAAFMRYAFSKAGQTVSSSAVVLVAGVLVCH